MPSRANHSTLGMDILTRARRIRQALLHSHILYQQRPFYALSLFDPPYTAEPADRIRLRGYLLYAMLFVCRVQATLSPDKMERAGSEAEAQTIANQALSATITSQAVDPVMFWHLEERNDLARSVVRTRDQWASAWEHGKTREGLISFLLQRFQKWLTSWSKEILDTELG